MNAIASQPRIVASNFPTPIPAATPLLWMLYLAKFNPYQLDYTVKEVAAVFNLTGGGVRWYCRDLWPDKEPGHFRFDYPQLCVLVYRICRDGQRLPKATELHRAMLVSGEISTSFPRDRSDIARDALSAILAAREDGESGKTRSRVGYCKNSRQQREEAEDEQIIASRSAIRAA